MIDFVYDELVRIGFVENRSQFSKEWLGKNGAYMRSLASKRIEPSVKAIATCAHILQNKGDSLILYGDRKSKSTGKELIKLSRKCVENIVGTGYA